MTKDDKIKGLSQQLKELKSQVAATKSLQKKRDRLQQEFEESQMRFKTVFEQSTLGKKFIDSDLKIIKVNQALVELLGYSKKELLGTQITSIAHPSFLDSWRVLQHELWGGKRPSFSIETCLLKKDKSFIWCNVISILVRDNGNTLGYTTLEDISVRKKLEQELKDARDREVAFHQDLLEVTVNTQEAERSRIAEDLHNSLGQLLYGAKLILENIVSGDQKETESALKQAKATLHSCISECRKISHDLMPSILEDFGLKHAIEDICSRQNEYIQFTCQFIGFSATLPKYLETAVYRIVQELIMNIVKHSGATQARLVLKIKGNDLSIQLEDNGNGFDLSKSRGDGIGLRSIKNKLYLLKGELDVSSVTGVGTTISIQLPIKLAQA